MKLSVCLATYNGDRFISEQVTSILPQLRDVDELVISDDMSMDGTISIVEDKFLSKSINLSKNSINLGHVKNFEKLFSMASGDIIFLCDQDDVWDPRKVECVSKIFADNPDVSLVHHSMATIDVFGSIINPRYVTFPLGRQNSFSFILRELLKPRVFGCAMAVRRNVLDVLLPFPRFVYAHDHWLGVAAAMVGKVYFSNDILLMYRQHGGNLTPKKSRSFLQIFKSRCLFSILILTAMLRRFFKRSK